MLQSITITSKRQITIPSEIFRRLNLEQGDRLLIDVDDQKIYMQKAQNLLDELAGSVPIPSRFRRLSLDQIINKSKEEYFNEKK